MKKQIIFNWGEFNQRMGEDLTSDLRGNQAEKF
jgi:hypothetical protein